MSPTVVVDASLAIKWVLQESYTTEALALLTTWRTQQTGLAAPTLLAYEIANVLHKRIGRGELSLQEARTALATILGAGIALTTQPGLHERALELAQQFGRPAAYDTHYLALAEQAGWEFWTADERLWNSVKSRLPWVRWIGSQAPTA